MTWTAVESKMFSAIAYEASGATLYLRFRRGDVYRYFEFSAQDYENFLAAESKGRFFLSEMRIPTKEIVHSDLMPIMIGAQRS